jgi:hypothetical protein
VDDDLALVRLAERLALDPRRAPFTAGVLESIGWIPRDP